MKRVIVVLIGLLLSGCAAGQYSQIKEEDKTISNVYEAPGFAKDALYEKVKIWITQNFKSAKAVIEYDNKADGTVIGNGSVNYPCSGIMCMSQSGWMVPFQMKVDMKDNKFKVTFTNIRISTTASTTMYGTFPASEREIWQQSDYDLIKPILLNFGNDIKTSLAKNTKADNW